MSFFTRLDQAGLRIHANQWGTLVSLSQYRTPYQITQQHLRPPAKVLDWGAGNGHFSFFLTSQGIQTVGFSFEDMPAIIQTHRCFAYMD